MKRLVTKSGQLTQAFDILVEGSKASGIPAPAYSNAPASRFQIVRSLEKAGAMDRSDGRLYTTDIGRFEIEHAIEVHKKARAKLHTIAAL